MKKPKPKDYLAMPKLSMPKPPTPIKDIVCHFCKKPCGIAQVIYLRASRKGVGRKKGYFWCGRCPKAWLKDEV